MKKYHNLRVLVTERCILSDLYPIIDRLAHQNITFGLVHNGHSALHKQRMYEIWREPFPDEEVKGRRKTFHRKNKIIERELPPIDKIEVLFVGGKIKWDHRKGNGT